MLSVKRADIFRRKTIHPCIKHTYSYYIHRCRGCLYAMRRFLIKTVFHLWTFLAIVMSFEKRGMLRAASGIILALVLYIQKNYIENTVVISTALWHRIICLLKHNKKCYSVGYRSSNPGRKLGFLSSSIYPRRISGKFIPLTSVYQEFWEGTFIRYCIYVYYLYENGRTRQIHVPQVISSIRTQTKRTQMENYILF